MKILLVHNDYGIRSGEEAAVDRMAAMFSEMGHELTQLRMSTAGLRESFSGKVRAFLSGIYCSSGISALRGMIKNESPDVVNVHNLYPFISPAALRVCKKADIPVIMTIHNFRLICPTGLLLRDSGPCELCLKSGNEWNCIRHNCEHSILKSVGYALRNAVARTMRHYLDCVDLFVCLTEFQRGKLIEGGIPSEKIVVIPNSADVAGRQNDIVSGGYVAYCGRISREKGVDLIIEAARRHPAIPFCFAGAVRDPELLNNLPENIRYMGYLSGSDLDDFYRRASFMVMASRWYEGFPMTILEAARYGKSTIGPDHGGFTEIIGKGRRASGLLFRPGDVDSLQTAVSSLWSDRSLRSELGGNALLKLEKHYSTEVIARQWALLMSSCLTARRPRLVPVTFQ